MSLKELQQRVYAARLAYEALQKELRAAKSGAERARGEELLARRGFFHATPNEWLLHFAIADEALTPQNLAWIYDGTQPPEQVLHGHVQVTWVEEGEGWLWKAEALGHQCTGTSLVLVLRDGNKHVTVMNAAGCVSDFKDGYLYLRPTLSPRWRVPRSVLAVYEDRTPPLFQWYDLLSRGNHEEIRNALPSLVGSPLFMGTADLLSKLISL